MARARREFSFVANKFFERRRAAVRRVSYLELAAEAVARWGCKEIKATLATSMRQVPPSPPADLASHFIVGVRQEVDVHAACWVRGLL